MSPQQIPSDVEDTSLVSLTMDAKGHLLVGEVNQKYISKHKLDGSHVASIMVDLKPMSIAVTSQDVIIMSDLCKSVHIVDNKGQLLHTVSPPTNVWIWDPMGIACYNDIICICNYDAGIIHCYSVSGEYLSDIAIIIPGKPKHLTFTPEGKQLMVSCGAMKLIDGVPIYRLQ